VGRQLRRPIRRSRSWCIAAGGRRRRGRGRRVPVRDPLASCGGYPELTQTFITASCALRRRGHLRLLAAHRVDRHDLDPTTAALAEAALVLGCPAESVCAARLGRSAPGSFARLLRWVRRQPHRTRCTGPQERDGPRRCGRVNRVQNGVRYLHAHFAGYQPSGGSSRVWPGSPTAFRARDRHLPDRTFGREYPRALLVISCTQYNVDHLRAEAPAAADRVHLSGTVSIWRRSGRGAPRRARCSPLTRSALVEKKLRSPHRRGGELEHSGRHPLTCSAGATRGRPAQRIADRGIAHRVELRGAVANRGPGDSGGLHRPGVPSVQAGTTWTGSNVNLEASAMGPPSSPRPSPGFRGRHHERTACSSRPVTGGPGVGARGRGHARWPCKLGIAVGRSSSATTTGEDHAAPRSAPAGGATRPVVDPEVAVHPRANRWSSMPPDSVPPPRSAGPPPRRATPSPAGMIRQR
jgi:hypothetical protein